MTRTLTLFPDTNIFIQCKALLELDWRLLDIGEVDRIDLIVSRPVQVEIDAQKGRGDGRVGKRSRAAHSMFGKVLDDPQRMLPIAAKPVPVRLLLGTTIKPDPALKDDLSFDERDDQLVGIVAAYAKAHPEETVRLITMDIGPRASADAVGVPCLKVPAQWALEPESDDMQKKLAAAQAENARLRRADPEPKIRFVLDGAEIEFLRAASSTYPPLEIYEVDALMARIEERFPIATDFGGDEPQGRPSASFPLGVFVATREIYVPSTREARDKYTESAYPDWLASCRQVLTELHARLFVRAKRPRVDVCIRNQGNRPAQDCVVVLAVEGSALMMRDEAVREAEKSAEASQPISLPSAPEAPKGYWTRRSLFDAIPPLGQTISNLMTDGGWNERIGHPPLGLNPRIAEPDEFVWKSPGKGVATRYELRCRQWRHGDEEMAISIVLVADHRCDSDGKGVLRGQLKASVAAANLSDAVGESISLEFEVVVEDTLAIARALVEDMGGTSGKSLAKLIGK